MPKVRGGVNAASAAERLQQAVEAYVPVAHETAYEDPPELPVPELPPILVAGTAAATYAAAMAQGQPNYGMAAAPEVQAKVEEMKPPPIPTPMAEDQIAPKWMTKYEELVEYKDKNGDMNVPNTGAYKQLHAWIRTQKQQYKLCYEGKTNHISQLRINMLNEIGFPWAGEKRDQFWNDRYQELVAFHAKTGTSRVPEKYDAAPQLHTWVSLQRRQLKLRQEGKPTKLTDERVALLDQVGLECKIRNVATWMDRFMELKRYKDEHGDCNVPQKWKQNTSLGRWVDNQKTQHKKLYDGKPTHLTVERIQLLVSLGFNWRRT